MSVELMLCEVFRSPRREGMYLYVDRQEGLERVPAPLLKAFGIPERAMLLKLDGQRKLARADAEEVLHAIATEGYYLQMPPSTVSPRESARAGPGEIKNDAH